MRDLRAGVDTVSDPPIVYPKAYQQLLLASYRGRTFGARLAPWLSLRPRHLKPVLPGVIEPRTGLSMGQSTELMVKTWKISRIAQDELAFESHQNAAKAWREGFFSDLVIEYLGLKMDNNVRPDTSTEKLSKLKPTFDFTGSGTLTAGNSTPLTDGAAAVLLATEEWAAERKLPVLAHLTYGKAWAVDFVTGKEGLLMAPTYAVAAMLKDAGLTLQDFDYYEIHEAFAGQVLCTLAAWESADLLPRRPRRETAPGRHRPRAPQRKRRQRRARASICRNRRAHRGNSGEDPCQRSERQTRTRLGLHRRRHGSDGDPGALTDLYDASALSSVDCSSCGR